MCEGFGIIATKDGRLLFIEPDMNGNVSHSEIIRRASIPENKSPIERLFVRVEFPDWTEESFQWDEEDTLPVWADDELAEMCRKLLLRVTPALAEYKKVCDAAWAEYEKVSDAAWAEYEKVSDAELAEYEKVSDAAWAEYEKVRAPAWADMVKAISTITGYVPA